MSVFVYIYIYIYIYIYKCIRVLLPYSQEVVSYSSRGCRTCQSSPEPRVPPEVLPLTCDTCGTASGSEGQWCV